MMNKALWTTTPKGRAVLRGIAAVSKAMATKRRAYNARVKVWLVGKRCAVFYQLTATQCHHQRGRLGSLLMDERFWIPVSAAGHALIDANRDAARTRTALLNDGRKLTLLCERGQFNVRVPL